MTNNVDTNENKNEELDSLLEEVKQIDSEVDKIFKESNDKISSIDNDVDNIIGQIEGDLKDIDSIENEASDEFEQLIEEESKDLSNDNIETNFI